MLRRPQVYRFLRCPPMIEKRISSDAIQPRPKRTFRLVIGGDCVQRLQEGRLSKIFRKLLVARAIEMIAIDPVYIPIIKLGESDELSSLTPFNDGFLFQIH